MRATHAINNIYKLMSVLNIYDMITRWGEYEYQCEMKVIYSGWRVEQINDYLVIDTYK